MRSLAAALTLATLSSAAVAQDDLSKLYIEQVDQQKEREAEATLKAIVAKDNAVEVLADTYKRGLKLIVDLAKEEQKWAKAYEDNKVTFDSRGAQIKGNAMEEWKARDYLAICRGRMGVADDMVPLVCRSLFRLQSEPQIAGLVTHMASGPDWYFRASCVAAVGVLGKHKLQLVDQLKKESDAGVRVALLDALSPHIGTDKSLQLDFLEQLTHPYWQVQFAAHLGLRIACPKTSIPKIIDGMKGKTGRMEWEYNQTLKAMTHVDKHIYDAWKAWWDAHGDEVLAGTYSPHISERADAPGQSTFYGLEIHSDHLAIQADYSSSMMQGAAWKPPDNSARAEPFKGSTRIDVARYELKGLLTQLPSGVRLNIIAFTTFLTLYDQQRAVPIDDSARKKMKKWVDETKVDSGTNIWDAFRRGFEIGGGLWNEKLKSDSLDTFALMTDGDPTGRVLTKKLMLEKLSDYNRFRKIRIYTIGVEPSINGEDLLKEIAAQHYGAYQRR